MVERRPMPDDVAENPESVFGAAAHWTIEQGRRLWTSAPGPVDRFVLEVEGAVVAGVGAFHSRLHPTRNWAFVEVVEAHRRCGIGRGVVAILREPSGALGLRCKAERGSAGEDFATSVGLEPLMGTRTVRVSGGIDSALADEVEAVSVSAAGDEVVNAWRRYYEGGHTWDPVGKLEGDFWRETLDGANDEEVMTLRLGDSIRGIAFLGSDGEWTGGAVDRSDPDAGAIASGLLAAAFPRSPTLDIELDDWMAELDDALGGLHVEELDRSVILADPP